MADVTMAIEARGLAKRLDGRVVLGGIDLKVASGACVAVTGPNGSGKTTLLRCLAGMSRPTAGEVRWFGERVVSNPGARRLVGMVSHQSHLYPHLTLRENLLFAARMSGVRDPIGRADRLLSGAGLRQAAACRPTEVSRGMRQRASVARALVHEPHIVLLDEPFTALDAEGTEWLVRLLEELQDCGRAICLASHDEHGIALLASRVLRLPSGRLCEAVTERYPAVKRNSTSRRAA